MGELPWQEQARVEIQAAEERLGRPVRHAFEMLATAEMAMVSAKLLDSHCGRGDDAGKVAIRVSKTMVKMANNAIAAELKTYREGVNEITTRLARGD